MFLICAKNRQNGWFAKSSQIRKQILLHLTAYFQLVRQRTAQMFWRVRSVGLWLTVAILFITIQSISAGQVHARGTGAGTIITNQAELHFSQGGVHGAVVRSNMVQFAVFEVIDVAVQALDAASVATGSPDLAVPVSFRVTNLGNAAGSFRLERLQASNPGDFTPVPANVGAIFIENGLQAGFQASGPNADTRYVAGGSDITLSPDASQIVYLVSDFQASLTNGSVGRLSLRAFSNIQGAAGAAPGSSLSLPNATQPAIIGASSATAQASGSYLITGMRVVMTKSQVAVRAPNGTTALISGAECDYLVDVQVFGSNGQIDDFEIDDPLPAVLSYIGNSLKINGQAKSDVPDGDEAQVVDNRISIRFGKLFPSNRFQITYTTRLQ
jgi:hypothetical protein